MVRKENIKNIDSSKPENKHKPPESKEPDYLKMPLEEILPAELESLETEDELKKVEEAEAVETVPETEELSFESAEDKLPSQVETEPFFETKFEEKEIPDIEKQLITATPPTPEKIEPMPEIEEKEVKKEFYPEVSRPKGIVIVSIVWIMLCVLVILSNLYGMISMKKTLFEFIVSEPAIFIIDMLIIFYFFATIWLWKMKFEGFVLYLILCSLVILVASLQAVRNIFILLLVLAGFPTIMYLLTKRHLFKKLEFEEIAKFNRLSLVLSIVVSAFLFSTVYTTFYFGKKLLQQLIC